MLTHEELEGASNELYKLIESFVQSGKASEIPSTGFIVKHIPHQKEGLPKVVCAMVNGDDIKYAARIRKKLQKAALHNNMHGYIMVGTTWVVPRLNPDAARLWLLDHPEGFVNHPRKVEAMFMHLSTPDKTWMRAWLICHNGDKISDLESYEDTETILKIEKNRFQITWPGHAAPSARS